MLEVVEWIANTAKVKIPADLPAGIQAELEIIRADGTRSAYCGRVNNLA